MTPDEPDGDHAVCSLALSERRRNAQGGVMGGRLVATARYRKDGRSSCVVNVGVSDDAGRDVAPFAGTGFLLRA